MKDNLDNELHIGDYVFCLTGSLKNTIQKIQKTRKIEEIYGVREGVDFGNKHWISDYNTISLNALGVTATETVSKPGCDALGNALNIGDKVLYAYSLDVEIGVVKKLSAKTCLLEIEEKFYRGSEYRKKYEEIISLTALGKEDIVLDPYRRYNFTHED
jgi:hypothetical protein